MKFIFLLRNLLFNNFYFIILSFILWLFVRLSDVYQYDTYINVNYVNIPKDKTIQKTNREKVFVKLSLSGFKLYFYKIFKTYDIDINLSLLNKISDSLFYWIPDRNRRVIKNNLIFNPRVSEVSNDTLFVSFDYKDYKKVPVILVKDIKFSNGYDFYDTIRVNPDSVKLWGDRNMLRGINYLNTKKLVIRNLNEDLYEKLYLDLSDIKYKGIDVSSSYVYLNSDVEPFTEKIISIPIDIINIDSVISKKVEILEKKVEIKFKVTLKDYEKISKEDFIVVCDFGNFNKNSLYMALNLIKHPLFLKDIRIYPNKVRYFINN